MVALLALLEMVNMFLYRLIRDLQYTLGKTTPFAATFAVFSNTYLRLSLQIFEMEVDFLDISNGEFLKRE
jgi:hypothetical protein